MIKKYCYVVPRRGNLVSNVHCSCVIFTHEEWCPCLFPHLLLITADTDTSYIVFEDQRQTKQDATSAAKETDSEEQSISSRKI